MFIAPCDKSSRIHNFRGGQSDLHTQIIEYIIHFYQTFYVIYLKKKNTPLAIFQNLLDSFAKKEKCRATVNTDSKDIWHSFSKGSYCRQYFRLKAKQPG